MVPCRIDGAQASASVRAYLDMDPGSWDHRLLTSVDNGGVSTPHHIIGLLRNSQKYDSSEMLSLDESVYLGGEEEISCWHWHTPERR